MAAFAGMPVGAAMRIVLGVAAPAGGAAAGLPRAAARGGRRDNRASRARRAARSRVCCSWSKRQSFQPFGLWQRSQSSPRRPRWTSSSAWQPLQSTPDVLEAARGMTLLAGDRGVHAQQRESAHVVFEEHLVRPAPLVVTRVAGLALLSAMHVVFAVAAVAAWSRASRVPSVPVWQPSQRTAWCAPAQREIGHAVVIEAFGLPGGLAVTAVTTVAALAAVHVVGAMARDTVARELGGQTLRMARRAGELGVSALQGELGVARVIEARRLPGLRGMAVFAARTKAPQMRIVRGGDSRCSPARCSRSAGSGGRARRRRRGARPSAGSPSCRDRTSLWPRRSPRDSGRSPRRAARGGHRRRGGTRCRRLGASRSADAGLVAALAGEAHVGAVQRVIGEAVIEGRAIEADHVGVASLVLRVAVAASGLRALRARARGSRAPASGPRSPSSWQSRHKASCDALRKGAWHLPQSASISAWPFTTGPGITSFSRSIAPASAAPAARQRRARPARRCASGCGRARARIVSTGARRSRARSSPRRAGSTAAGGRRARARRSARRRRTRPPAARRPRSRRARDASTPPLGGAERAAAAPGPASRGVRRARARRRGRRPRAPRGLRTRRARGPATGRPARAAPSASRCDAAARSSTRSEARRP